MIASQRFNFSFPFLSNRCVFDSFCYWFLKRYLVSDFTASNYESRVSIYLKIVYIMIRQGAPLGLAVEMN